MAAEFAKLLINIGEFGLPMVRNRLRQNRSVIYVW
jgi:hypothetical protein